MTATTDFGQSEMVKNAKVKVAAKHNIENNGKIEVLANICLG